MMRRSRRAFSLIELIVVVGIIAILIGMLLPTLSNVREQAKTLQCMSQLRQIGFAIQQYSIANHGNTPVWSIRHEWPDDIPPVDGVDLGPAWTVLIERYLGQNPDGPVWNCPSWPEPERRVNYFLGARWMHEQQPLLRSIQISKIRNSTTYIFAGECTAQRYYVPPFGTDEGNEFEDIDKDDGAIKCLAFFGEVGGMNMHRQGNNVLFADNHVATFRKWNAQELTYSPLSMQDFDSVGPE
jgi:prepilin-type N-terminal cleavage/methylation domain-containing protein/prepilin-type processing-associated H-X9-DG protein